MANQQGNGRNAAAPDENRPSWRPEDDNGIRQRRGTSEDDRYMSRERDRDRYGSHWDERSSRWDRDEGYRSIERYGQGQSGYGGGRYEEDRSYSSRNIGYPGSMEERARERGLDERFSQGRGGGGWGERGYERGYERGERDVGGGGYGHGRYETGGGYLSQPSRQMSAQHFGDEEWGNEGFTSGRSSHGNQSGYGSPGHWRQGPGERGYGYGGQGYGGSGEQGMYGRRPERGPRGTERGMYGGGQVPTGQGGLYGQGGYTEGMYGQGGMQQRYGSQGYQGFGGERHERPSHRGKGPSSYTRSDERIRENVCEALYEDHNVDATNVEVTVKSGEVTLTGSVDDRMQKRMAEDCVLQVAGVKDVQNQLRVASERKPPSSSTAGKESESSASPTDKRNRA